MSQSPRLEVVPVRPAVRSDVPVTLDVLIKITPPEPETPTSRPALNLGLVIDRSGSMAGRRKIEYAREAAAFAVRELAPTDRVSLTIFDDKVQTLFANAPADDKTRLLGLIEKVQPGGSTALHGGWAEGAAQVVSHVLKGGLNRVLFLSDGLANVGESRPDAIADDVHKRAGEGVSTTTLGLGDDYNEDLLEAMARSGDGNYYYVESANQLPAIFHAELRGLAGTAGTEVTLAVHPGAGVTVADVLNDVDRTPDGRLRLPNLVAGFPVYVVVRLNVPAGTGDVSVGRFELGWVAPGGAGRQSATVGLNLPGVPASVWDALAETAEVRERAVLLHLVRHKKAATRAVERGDPEDARRLLAEARKLLAAAPRTPEIENENQSVMEIDAYIERGEWMKFQKHAKHQAYSRSQSRPYVIPESRGEKKT